MSEEVIKDAEFKEVATAEELKEYAGPMGNYKITGEAFYTNEQGVISGTLEIGSVQTLPSPIGDVFVEKGVAEFIELIQPELPFPGEDEFESNLKEEANTQNENNESKETIEEEISDTTEETTVNTD